MTTNDPMIAALLREREGYIRRSLPDRAAQVDAELKRHGYEPDSPDDAPKKRGRPPKATAD